MTNILKIYVSVPQQQPQSASEIEQIYCSVMQCAMYGDERDEVLTKWNLLQASWGTGKGTSIPIFLEFENNFHN